MNSYKFDTNKHSVFLLYYHLILVVYRRKMINQNVRLVNNFVSHNKISCWIFAKFIWGPF